MCPIRDLLKSGEMPVRVDEACAALDRHLGTTTVLHDLGSMSYAPDGASLLPESRRVHTHPVCCLHRHEKAGWDRRCLTHCMVEMNEQAAARTSPFVHHCWKGMAEVVVPIRVRNVHVSTMFVGGYASADRPAGLPPEVHDMLAKLPVMEEQAAAQLAPILQCFAEGVALLLEDHVSQRTSAANRFEAILRLVRRNLNKPFGLPDLAAELRLSESRTSHVVRELFDMPFQNLIAAQRIARARVLLATTYLTHKEIAVEVGYGSEYYLSRVFKKIVGMPPGRYRKLHR